MKIDIISTVLCIALICIVKIDFKIGTSCS